MAAPGKAPVTTMASSAAFEPESHRPPPPAPKYQGEEATDRFNDSFKALAAISTLGASITFSQVVTAAPEPLTYHGFDRESIQKYMAMSWLFFMLDLISALVAGSVLALYRPETIRHYGDEYTTQRRVVMMWYSSAICFLFILLILAFIFLDIDIVVVAYAGAVGWTALAFTAFIGVWGILFIIWQSPIGARAPQVRTERLVTRSTEIDRYSPDLRELSRELSNLSGRGEIRPTIAKVPGYTVPGYSSDVRRSRSARIGDEMIEHSGSSPDPGTLPKELSAGEEIKEVESN